jgi:hypothetical protein
MAATIELRSRRVHTSDAIGHVEGDMGSARKNACSTKRPRNSFCPQGTFLHLHLHFLPPLSVSPSSLSTQKRPLSDTLKIVTGLRPANAFWSAAAVGFQAGPSD